MGRAALKGNTADGTYHLETYEPGEEEELPSGMNVWKIPQPKKALKSDLDRMTERFNVAMEHLSEGEQRAVRKELGEETNEDREQTRLDSFITCMMDEKEHTTGDYGWLEPNGTFHPGRIRDARKLGGRLRRGVLRRRTRRKAAGSTQIHFIRRFSDRSRLGAAA